MKKISIFLLAAMAMVSCGNSYKAKDVQLNDENDSLNYAVGLINGLQIKQYYLAKDSSEEAITEFIDALEAAYLDKEEVLSDIAQAGRQFGTSISMFEKEGLAGNAAWTYNGECFLQGLTNALYSDTSVMDESVAEGFIMAKYSTMRTGEEATGKSVSAKCPTKAKTIELKNENDSLNYAFGLMNGAQVRNYFLLADTTGEDRDEFIANINKGLKQKMRNPQVVATAKNIGTSIREQEPVGLMGFNGVETKFNLIKQGFINGLNNYTEMMDRQVAMEFADATFGRLKQAQIEAEQEKAQLQGQQAKEEGEAFLAANALRNEVKTTASGLQYEVLEEGNGPKPTAASTVKVHYEGTLIDGTVFDSSYQRGEPIEFPLSGVIKGWTEGLQLMPVGSKYKLYIPYELAYGERGAGASIPPYAALIFTVELLEIK